MSIMVDSIRIVLILLSIIPFQFCMNKTTTQTQNIKILFLGESTSLGVGASSPSKGFVYYMLDLSRKSGAKLDYRIVAKSGMNSTWGISQIDQINSYKPDIIIIDFFINDQQLSKEQVKSNYKVFSNIPFGFIYILDIYDSNSFNKFRNSKIPITEKPNYSPRWEKLIDTIDSIPNNWEIYLYDGTHPNDLGYGILGDLLYRETFSSILSLSLLKALSKDNP